MINPILHGNRCATILNQQCPACFEGVVFGRKLEEGGNIHVATDGNFHHRHQRSAGDSPHFYDPSYFLLKAQVDTIGHHIDQSRKSAPKPHAPLVHHEAIDLCENSYKAANGKKQKATMDSFDDTGYNILPETVTKRLRFATMAMHAYGHEWSCQLVYNPQICEGLGLSDGEGTERLWSRFIRLIGIQRSSSRQYRLWLIDRQAAAIGLEMRADLGDWIRHQLKCGIDEQGMTAQKTLNGCNTTIEDLRHHHQRLMDKVDVLYASLNINDKFPKLEGINIEFVQTLLLARDLKINIRKHAIGSFFEWDKLNCAVGGSQQALGTKLHQQTRKAILKRQPALLAALCKFNVYCERLEDLYESGCGIPLPTPLPTKLNELRDDQSLMEDIWIAPSVGEVTHWLDDQDVHDGICAMLKHDRCIKEKQHLGLEADNLCRWFGDELAAIELALQLPQNIRFSILLCQWQEHLGHLQICWSNPLASLLQFESQEKHDKSLAMRLSGATQAIALRWIPETSISCTTPLEDDEDPEIIPASNDVPPKQIALVDVMDIDTPDSEDEEDINIQTEHHAVITWHPPKIFEPKDIKILASCTAFLNDALVNGCAALIYSESLEVFSTVEQYAIMSTHDLPVISCTSRSGILEPHY
ncbi:uncharacterized protein EDB91DRAFT_1236330 [Suillus paluster]|uniref:uncharacterized protein n=1 Tax=Suillus paluster TaxID=48578 RepID=UPI001B860D8C|nr:uncharacterized protein EDB91DRAFT_1236330 [Suillus paluster]KAG1745423.1 hypothetical protein EDB91DRAFT_1236330 [Suillus paluster]